MRGAVDLRSWALLAGLGIIWGGSFTATGFAVADAPPLSVAAGRLCVGALALIPLAFWLGDGLPRERRVWLFALGAALAANSIPFALLAWAQTHVASGLAGVFMATVPLIVLPLAHLFSPGEHMTWPRTLGFVIGFAGVVTLIGLDALRDLGGAPVEVIAQLACVGAASGYALGSIITRRAPRIHPLSFAAATLLIASCLLAPIAIWIDRPFARAWSTETLLAVAWLGLVPTALATIMLIVVIARAGAVFFSLVNYQAPIWAMIFGVTLLGEALPARVGLALALIFAGVAIAQFGARWLDGRASGGERKI